MDHPAIGIIPGHVVPVVGRIRKFSRAIMLIFSVAVGFRETDLTGMMVMRKDSEGCHDDHHEGQYA